jgi:hypothetical protein
MWNLKIHTMSIKKLYLFSWIENIEEYIQIL